MLRPRAPAPLYNQMKTFLLSRKFILNVVRSTHGRKGGIDKSGSARDIFKSIGTAKEAQFFKKREQALLKNLKDEMKEQISFHEEQIEIHKAVIEKLKRKQKDL
ncbi:hypothetical protein PYW08_003095 [Mythimna loreyi]|uniref:Uncharacterized protein n=1 Tax=Mythimna loreyi TaxID=667449 RepID=A0ACC2QQT0_9NEOP|nr:hypothetical protein PYW08_003095 [Mythimna loreyi]